MPSWTISQLIELIPGATAIGTSDIAISDITDDSRKVKPGSLFVARRGGKFDGLAYAGAALERGAVCVLCQADDGGSLDPRIEVPDLQSAWGLFAHKIFGEPCHRLAVVGVTGTNGKTTVTNVVAQALERLGKRAARTGTLGFFVGEQRISDSLTTPMPDTLARMLGKAADLGAEYAVLEVSSHALNQKRIAGVEFAVTAFTNLSQDHLDYHGTIEAYAREKERLFSDYPSRSQVFNLDDAVGQKWLDRHASRRLTWGVSTRSHPAAQLIAEDAQFSAQGIVATIREEEEVYTLRSSLLGRHNLENLLVSLAILRHLGFAASDVVRVLEQTTGVAGRLERCDDELDDVVVVVDYAHTPDALRRVLGTLHDLDFEELVCVFGCGGDRDKTKRPMMGRAVADLADRIFVTSDNPRTEDPAAIISDILPGLVAARSPIDTEVDRRSSIERAVLTARPGACVLIAGKGHEDYQIVGDQVIPFDDRVEARRALALRRGRSDLGS